MTRIAESRIAILATDGYERSELRQPLDALRARGATVEDYDALVLPGGQINPDKLRTDAAAVRFVAEFVKSGKTVAAICHGPWLLVEADAVRGRDATSFPSIRTDLLNAGANWRDAEVVVDEGMVTSRNPDDLPAFIAKIVEEIEQGRHDRAA